MQKNMPIFVIMPDAKILEPNNLKYAKFVFFGRKWATWQPWKIPRQILRRPLRAAIAQLKRQRGGGRVCCHVLARNVIFPLVVVEVEHITVVVDINKKVGW